MNQSVNQSGVDVEEYVRLLKTCLQRQQTALEETKLNLTNLLFTLRASKEKQYKFHEFKLNWTEAAESCEGEGQMLATIRSKEDYDKFVSDTPKTDAGVAQFWVGGFDPTNSGRFVWVVEHGEDTLQFSFVAWAAGQPRRTDSPEYEECVLSAASNWTVAPCSRKLFYVCEYFSAPLLIERAN